MQNKKLNKCINLCKFRNSTNFCAAQLIHLTLANIKMNETEYKGILHKEVNWLSNISPRFHRISCMLLDHFIMSFLTVPIAFLTFIIVYQFEHSLENLAGISLFSIAMFFVQI